MAGHSPQTHSMHVKTSMFTTTYQGRQRNGTGEGGGGEMHGEAQNVKNPEMRERHKQRGQDR